LAALARRLASAGVTLEHLDLGGGLGISYDGKPVPDVADYVAALVGATRDSGCSLILEPGRWLVAPAGALVATVVDVKVHPARRDSWCSTRHDDLLRPALYSAFHRIVPLERDGRPA